MSVRAFHDAARRYLLERTLEDDADVGTARILLLAIERTTPQDYRTVEAARAALIELGCSAQAAWLPAGPARHAAPPGVVERQQFISYLERLTDAEAVALPPLPARRVMTLQHRRAVFRRLRLRWPIVPQPPHHRTWWHPMDAVEVTQPAVHLQTAWFDQQVTPQTFRTRLATHTGGRLWGLLSFIRGNRPERVRFIRVE